MAFYEHVLIARPEISPQQVEALIEDITKTDQGTRRPGHQERILGPAQSHLPHPQEPQGALRAARTSIARPPAVHELERRLRINEDVMRFKTIRVEELDAEPSPILARRDREERRRARREGRDDDGNEITGEEE